MNDTVLTHRIGSVQPSNTLEARVMRKMRLMSSPGGNNPIPLKEEPRPPHKVKLVFEGGQYEDLTIFDDEDGNDTVTTTSMTRTTMSSHFMYGVEDSNLQIDAEDDDESEQSDDDSSASEDESTASEDESINQQSYHGLLTTVQEVVEKATKVLLNDETLSVMTEPPMRRSQTSKEDDSAPVETLKAEDYQVIHSAESQDLISEIQSFSKEMEERGSNSENDSDDDTESLDEFLGQNEDIVIIDEVPAEEAMKAMEESNKRTHVHAFAAEVIVAISPPSSQEDSSDEDEAPRTENDLYSKSISEYSELLEEMPPPPPPPALPKLNAKKGVSTIPPPLVAVPEEETLLDEDVECTPNSPPLPVEDFFREALKAKIAKQPTKSEIVKKEEKELPESASVFTSTTVGASNLTKLTSPMMESTTNVHHCVSATCLACRKAEAEVVGSPRRMMSRPLAGTKWWEAPNTEEEETWISEKMQPFLDMVGLDKGAFTCGSIDGGKCMQL